MKEVQAVTHEEFTKALKSMNKGKLPDIYGLTIENLYGGAELQKVLLEVVNNIFTRCTIPDMLKGGLLTPVFKKKGKTTDA